MKRIALVSALLGTLVLAFAGVASAYTVNSDGSLYVSKGEVQSAMKWNNSDFDKNVNNVSFAFGTGSRVDHARVNYACGEDKWSAPQSDISWTRTVTNPQAVYSSNGKQITGWNLTDSGLTFAGMSWDSLAALNAGIRYNNCTNDVHSISVDQWTTGSTDGLTVNGKALSLTPTL